MLPTHFSWIIRLSLSSLLGLLCAFLTQVPLIGLPFALASIPLFMMFPEFSSSGPDVEFWFMGFMLKSNYSWMLFSIYFSVLAFVPWQLTVYVVSKSKSNKDSTD